VDDGDALGVSVEMDDEIGELWRLVNRKVGSGSFSTDEIPGISC